MEVRRLNLQGKDARRLQAISGDLRPWCARLLPLSCRFLHAPPCDSFPLFSVQVARIWTNCCSYCFRWTRTSPPSWLLRLPTPSYRLAWCGELHPLPCTSHLLIANGLDTTWWCLLMCTYPSSLNVCAIKLLYIVLFDSCLLA